MENRRKQIVVVGAGFGGLTFCQNFDHPDADITVVDRQNHHLFQPLLYQVAMAGLSPAEIAQPIRTILREHERLTVFMDEIVEFDLAGGRAIGRKREFPFDYLVLAAGARTGYFGHNEWAEHALGLKSISDAIRIRNHVLSSFEEAENSDDPDRIRHLLTLVVIGGGPTGVELAGALGELTRRVLARDFDRIDTSRARVILVEGGNRLLGMYSPEMSASAKTQLERIGVEVRLSTTVKGISKGKVDLGDEIIETENIIWGAGIEATPLNGKLGVETDRAGRVKIAPDLSLPGHPNVFAIGDMTTLIDTAGKPVPGVAPAAMQMAKHVAKTIRAELDGRISDPGRRDKFTYRDKGSMATIGRSAAVAEIGKLKMTGFPAWLTWLFIHLLLLIGMRNKAIVFFQWVVSYLTYRFGARIITRGEH